MKLPWHMSTKTVQNATTVVCPTIKETNACTERKLGGNKDGGNQNNGRNRKPK